MASGAFAGGAYQQTKRGKILIWNEHPNSDEMAKWSGRRDKNGYATGYGTLTWYRLEAPSKTGSHIPFTRPVIISRYSGKMVKGKLEGDVVSKDNEGRTAKVVFVNGREAKEKIAKAPEPPRTEVAVQTQTEPVPRAELIEPAAPAAGPVAPPAPPPVVASSPSNTQAPANAVSVKPVAAEKQSAPADASRTSAKAQAEAEESLRSLVGPPKLLRTLPPAGPSPQPSIASIAPTATPAPARPELAAAEAIELADGEARTQGYNLGEYRPPQAKYVAEEDAWTVSYSQKGADAASGTSKHFSVSVDDKTKRTSIAGDK